jgi:predicted N-acetyltransferase YhbS
VEIRSAQKDEIDQIIGLQVARNGPECDVEIREIVSDSAVGIERFTVAVESGRVVSSVALLTDVFRLEGREIPVGQPEFVATAEGYEHQGLVRRQIDLLHRWSAERGDLAQIIMGIPYFYRRFGYEYAIGWPGVRVIHPGVQLDMPAGWSVRRALESDVPEIMAMEADIQSSASLSCARSERWWRWWTRPKASAEIWVAEMGGSVAGSARLGNGPPGLDGAVTAVTTVAGRNPNAVWALLAEAARRGRPVALGERRGIAEVAYPVSTLHRSYCALYARVGDPVALLDWIRPVLSARLARSPYGKSSGRLLLSTYSSSMTIDYEQGGVSRVAAGPPEQAPDEKGGAGVPPDLIATLIFGRHGAKGLEARHDDVHLGPLAEIMEVLFPRLDVDLVTQL